MDDVKKLKERVKELECLMWLAARDVIFFGTYDDLEEEHNTSNYYPYLLCNDTFYWASADAEAIWPEDYQKVKEMFEKYGYSGVVAMIAIRRGHKPLERMQDDNYHKAYAELSKNK